MTHFCVPNGYWDTNISWWRSARDNWYICPELSNIILSYSEAQLIIVNSRISKAGIMPGYIIFFLQLVSEWRRHINFHWLGGNPDQWVLRVLTLHQSRPDYICLAVGNSHGTIPYPRGCLFHVCGLSWLTGTKCFVSFVISFCNFCLYTSCPKKSFLK